MHKRINRQTNSKNRDKPACVCKTPWMVPMARESDINNRQPVVWCIFFWSKPKVGHFYWRAFFITDFCMLYLHSQSRGISIPVRDITNLYEGQNIKIEFYKRKGFSKAYDEMQLFIQESNKTSKSNEKTIAANRCEKTMPSLRRSTRLSQEATINSSSVLRRSARLTNRLNTQK